MEYNIIMKKQETKSEELFKLRFENKRLKATIANSKKSHTFWRTSFIVFLVGFGGALLVLGNIIFWSARTIINTDKYVVISSALVAEPDIQQAIAKKTTDAIFANVNVTQVAKDALPPKAEFLAGPLSTQVQSYAQKGILTIVASQQFQTVWENANRTAHQKLLKVVTNYKGDGTIDLNGVFQHITQQLSDTKLSFLNGQSLPNNVGSYQVVSAAWLPKAHWFITNLTLLRILTLTTFIGCITLAMAVSQNRRRLLISSSLIFSGLMLASIIAFRITRQIAVGQVNPTYQVAAQTTWTTILHGLFTQTLAIIVLFLIIAFAAWVSGGGRRAKVLRTKVDDVLAGKLHQSVFGKNENSFTRFVGSHKNIFRWLIFGLGTLSLLFTSLTAATLILTAVIVGIAILLLEFLGA
jgi:hypothetical protein